MKLRRLGVAIVFGIGLPAFSQTAAITSPASGAVLAGTSTTITSTCTACPSAFTAEYDVDGELQGIVRVPVLGTFIWNTYYAANGTQHVLTAVYRDALNNIVATSPGVTVAVENNLPQNTCPPNGTTCTDMTVTTGEVAKIVYPSNVSWTINTVSFQGAGGVSKVGSPQISAGTVSSPFSFSSYTSVATHLIAVFARVSSGSQTLSCSDNKGDTFVSLPVQAGNGFSSQWCYAKGIAGGAGTVVTVTSSASAAVLAYLFELSGADPNSPLDVNVNNSSSNTLNPNDSNVYSAPFNLGFPAANEIVLAGGTWNSISHSPSASAAWTLYHDSSQESAVMTINPPSAWFGSIGLIATVNGGNSGISKNFQVSVDGLPVLTSNPTSGATMEEVLDTSRFSNAAHAVVLTATGGNCPGCSDGTWNFLGQWEQMQNFSNGASPNELRANYRDVTLCMTASSNCPTSVTLTGAVYNSDGSSTPDASSFSSSDTTCATVTSPGGIVSPVVSNCSASITLTSANGSFTRTVWVVVPPSVNNVPHFNCATGAILTTYTPGQSCWQSSLYSGSGGFAPVSDSQFNYAAQWGAALKTAFNTINWPIPALNTTEAAYDSAANSNTNTLLGYMASNGLYCQLQGFSVTESTPQMFNLIYGIGAAYVTPPLTYYLTRLANNCANIILSDEVSTKFPGNPLAGTDGSGLVIGTNGFTQIACTAGATCTVSWTNWSVAANNDFIILGSGDPNLDYNTTSGAPRPYSSSRVDQNHFTFATPPGVGTTTYTPASNPGLRIEYFVAYTFDAGAVNVDNTIDSSHSCPNGGASAGPCPLYLHYDVYKKTLATITNVSGHPQFTNPSASGTFGFSVSNWCGKNSVGGVRAGTYCLGYWNPSGTYLGLNLNLTGLTANSSTGEGNTVRMIRSSMDLGTPLLMETAATTTDYTYMGNTFAVVSCSGNTFTTSTPHQVYTIFPGVTRMSVVGSTGAACDGNYYILAAPTATTLTVALANATFSGTGNNGTLTFQNGDQFTMNYVTANNTNQQESIFQPINAGNCPNTFRNHRGMTFTVSGSTNASVNSMTGAFMGDTPNPCSTNLMYWRQLPSLSGSGGTATIVRDHYLERGEKWAVNSEVGPRYMFASDTLVFILGAAGDLAYAWGLDPQFFDLTRTGNDSFGSQTGRDHFPPQTDFNNGGFVQGQINPLGDYSKSYIGWVAHTTANTLITRLIKYAYGQRLPAPDYGQFFETGAMTSAAGNILMIQSLMDAPASCTANLSPYLVANQPIIRISATWAGIEPIVTLAAGTASDTMTCQPGEFRAYLFPNNAATELQQPTISARLADIPNAAKVAVQFSYSALAFTGAQPSSQTLFQTIACGTGTCTLPVDKQIGTVYYRLIFLDANSLVRAASDIQVF